MEFFYTRNFHTPQTENLETNALESASSMYLVHSKSTCWASWPANIPLALILKKVKTYPRIHLFIRGVCP